MKEVPSLDHRISSVDAGSLTILQVRGRSGLAGGTQKINMVGRRTPKIKINMDKLENMAILKYGICRIVAKKTSLGKVVIDEGEMG